MFRPRYILAVLTAFGLFCFAASSLAAESGAAQQSEESKGLDLWQPGDPGERLHISGQVFSSDGEPLEGAVIYIRQADANGDYHHDRYRGTVTTGNGGRYSFGTVLPGQYDGVKHIHIGVTHDTHGSLETRILFKGDPYLDETTERDHAIFLEEATVEGQTVLFGRFDMTL